MNVYANDFNTTVQTYYTSLRKYKSISREKEKELFKQIKNNNNEQAKNEIIESHLKFVFDVAKCYKGKGVPLEDLISEGNIGLAKAINKFDENKGIKFITYAVWWIKQSILECLKKRNKISFNEVLEDDNLTNSNNDFCFDNVDDNNEIFNENYNITTEYDDVIKELNEVKSNVIKKLLKKLPYRGQKIIIYYYGLDNEEEKNLDEIGQELGITKERVRQIKEKCLKILRSEILMMDNFNDLFI
jgi:RNA polymerase primary sigma factor